MPEASVNENGRSIARQDDIWPPRQFRVQAESEAEAMERRTNLALGFRISALDARHHPTAGHPIDDVYHAVTRRRVLSQFQ